MLARTAAAEVALGDEDLCAFVLGLVEDEVGVGGGVAGIVEVIAPVVEEEVAVAGSLDSLEELLGDDLVGVDVGKGQRRGFAGEDVDGLHICNLEY